MSQIDWNDPKSKISKYFTVHEATYLPSWGISHIPTDEEKQNILEMAKKMDLIRDFIGEPIRVHCWIRPEIVNCPGNEHNGQNYNQFVGGVPSSAHKLGKAVDWSCPSYETTEYCDSLRQKLLPQLQIFDIRMENRSGPWVHVGDDWKSGMNHYFLP